MDSSYDVVFYFCGVHSSHVNKYLHLNKVANTKFKALMILSDGMWGVSKEVLGIFNPDDLVNVVISNYSEALNLLNSLDYKVGVFSSNFRKGTISNKDVTIAKAKGVKTLQISEMNIDFYYAGADYVSLISERFEKTTSLISDLKVSSDRKMYSNCFLWDVIEDCLPYHLSKWEFCKKYNLDHNKNIFMWGPDSIQCQHKNAQKAYQTACSVDNLIVKLHPNELRRYKAEKVGGRWSHDLYAGRDVKVLEPLDAHWAFKYMDCLIGYQSTLALEAPFYKKPTIYLGVDDKENMLFNPAPNIAYRGNYEWVGVSCDEKNFCDVIENNRFVVEESEYDKYKSRWLQYPSRNSVDILCGQISNLL